VRLGPFDSKDDAVAQQDKLKGFGTDAALVRVDRSR
jgi:cell division protein FtsN